MCPIRHCLDLFYLYISVTNGFLLCKYRLRETGKNSNARYYPNAILAVESSYIRKLRLVPQRETSLNGANHSFLCRKCGAEDETSAHVFCEGEALVALRHVY